MNSVSIRTSLLLLSLCLIGFCFAGCGKKQSAAPEPQDIGGGKGELPKLQQEFVNAPQDVLDLVHQTTSSMRYGQYEKALQYLDKLVNAPNLTDSQKKVVNDVIEQMKQVIAKVGPSR